MHPLDEHPEIIHSYKYSLLRQFNEYLYKIGIDISLKKLDILIMEENEDDALDTVDETSECVSAGTGFPRFNEEITRRSKICYELIEQLQTEIEFLYDISKKRNLTKWESKIEDKAMRDKTFRFCIIVGMNTKPEHHKYDVILLSAANDKVFFNYLEEKLSEIPETHFRAIEAHHVHLKQLFEKMTMKFV